MWPLKLRGRDGFEELAADDLAAVFLRLRMTNFGQQFHRLGIVAKFERDNDEVARLKLDRTDQADTPHADVASLGFHHGTNTFGVFVERLNNDLASERKPRVLEIRFQSACVKL